MPTMTLLQTIQSSMESSDFKYTFADPTPLGPSTAGILPHKSLPLSLLGLVNWGCTHQSLDEVRLRTEPAHNLTVGMLISNPSLHAKFANVALCIESGRLVLHLFKFCVFIIMHIANSFKKVFCHAPNTLSKSLNRVIASTDASLNESMANFHRIPFILVSDLLPCSMTMTPQEERRRIRILLLVTMKCLKYLWVL